MDHPPVIADIVDALDRAAAWKPDSGREMADVLSSLGDVFQSLTRVVANAAYEVGVHVTSTAEEAYTNATIGVNTARDQVSAAYDVFAREADFWLRNET